MKYKLEYSRELLSKEPFVLEEMGEIVSGLSFYVRFGTVFESDQAIELKVEVAKSFHNLSDLLKVSYSNETKKFEFLIHEEYKDNYEITSYFVDVGEVLIIPRICSKDEFYHIIQKYGERFPTDQSLQSCSYGVHKMPDKIPVSRMSQASMNVTTNNEVFLTLEEKLNKRKKEVESVPRVGMMAIKCRSSCLKQMKLIETAENKKNWLITHYDSNNNSQEIIYWYVHLINLYEQYKVFLEQAYVTK